MCVWIRIQLNLWGVEVAKRTLGRECQLLPSICARPGHLTKMPVASFSWHVTAGASPGEECVPVEAAVSECFLDPRQSCQMYLLDFISFA